MTDKPASPKKRGLGKGLDALLSRSQALHSLADTPVAQVQDGSLRTLPVTQIRPGHYQPRRDIAPEGLDDLAASIRAQGVMQPIVVRPLAVDSYEIIAGERRWRATQLAGLEHIPAVIREVSNEDAIAMALIENIQRENLNAMEEALALARLQREFELTQQQVADAVGKSRTAVTNLLRLLNLSAPVQRMLEHGDLEMGHARALLSLGEAQQITLARQVAAKGLSVRQTEALVQQQQREHSAPMTRHKLDANIKQLENSLSQRLGAQVVIRHGQRGRGSVLVKYNSLDELDGILAHIK